MNAYIHWRDRELMREPPWWNEPDEEEYPDPDLAWKERDWRDEWDEELEVRS